MKKLRLLGLVGLMMVFSCSGNHFLVSCNNVPPFIKPSIWIDTNKFTSATEKINDNGEDLTFFSYLGDNIPSAPRDGCGGLKMDCFSMIIKVIALSEKNMDKDYLLNVDGKKLSDNYKLKKLYVVLNDNSTLEIPLNQSFISSELGFYNGYKSEEKICISYKDLTKSKYLILEIFDIKYKKNLLLKSLFIKRL